MQLSAKFNIPYSNQHQFLLRARLVKKLDQSPTARLTLVSAPAGFGKTALLSSWAKLSKHPVVWLSLDERDNDPTIFMNLLIHGLQRFAPELGKRSLDMLNSTEMPSLEILTTNLIQEIDALEHGFNLIIDDYHKIHNPQIHQVIELFINHRTPQCRLIISTRSMAPWKLARYQLMGELVEVGTVDLRFTHQEVKSLFNEVIGFTLEEHDIAILTKKTEGWIAGLRMLALSLQDLENTPAMISSFLEPNRMIDNYFLEEVFERLSPDLQEFLMTSSILERLCPSLTDYVMEMAKSEALLAELENKNIFIISLDNQNNWYRYHHLFNEMLIQQYMDHSSPAGRRDVHLRASRWFEDHDLIEEALQHALAAEDIPRVVSLVENQSFALLQRGTLLTLLRWIETLPEKAVRQQPWLSVARCWALALSQRLEELKPFFDDLSQTASADDEKLKGHITALSMYFEADINKIKQYAETALEKLPEEAATIRVMIMKILGESLLQAGELAQAKASLKEAIASGQEVGDYYQLIKSNSSLAHVFILEGRLHDALEVLKGALSQAGDITSQLCGNFPQIASVYLQLAILYHEWYDLEKANKYIDLAYNSAVRLGDPGMLSKICITRADIKFVLGDKTGSDALIKEAKGMKPSTGIHQLDSQIPCYEANLSLLRRQHGKARMWTKIFEETHNGHFDFNERACVVTYAKYLTAQERAEEAINVLQTFSEVTHRSGSVLYSVRIHTALALALFRLGKQLDAMSNLEYAINLAIPNRLIRSIVTAGDGIEELLNRAYQLDIQPEFVLELLAIVRRHNSTEFVNELQELLSKREYQILKYLVTDLTVPEIASGLVLSAGTVRSHIKRIYRKLDVHRRHEAVAKAREMNLLIENNSVQWG
jgi:LuxR family maltose regulon positive regulatory protein